MTGRVDKGDEFAALFDLVGAHRLCDTARFFSGDIGFSDRVEECGFPVVDVSQDSNYRRTLVESFAGGFFLSAHLEEALERK